MQDRCRKCLLPVGTEFLVCVADAVGGARAYGDADDIADSSAYLCTVSACVRLPNNQETV